MADEDHSRRSGEKNKKRKHSEFSAHAIDKFSGMGQALPHLRQPDLPEFNLTSERHPGSDSPQANDKDDSKDEWQVVENARAGKKAKKIPKTSSSNYPSINFSHKDARLNSQIKICDLQNLVLYILADGSSPQFVSVRHRPEIRKVVVLMVPGLERSMFDTKLEHDDSSQPEAQVQNQSHVSPDDYYPIVLSSEKLSSSVQAFAKMFPHVWPVKTPGDDKYMKMHSPLHAMLTAPLPRNKDEKKRGKDKKGARPAQEPQGWKNTRTPITEFIHTAEDLLENDYTLHPAIYDEVYARLALEERRKINGTSKADNWVDTQVAQLDDGRPTENDIEAGSITAGRELLAMDCEMCMTGENEFSLTRISIVGWDGSVVMDELVKPEKPITNYLTQYSGITEEMLVPVTTTLSDIQTKLLNILHPKTVLIGHSLNSDLTALKITHPFIVDTALVYPHPRGPPLKSSLKWLAQRYLNREIQRGHGTTGPGAGHDSIEDARTCLDLVKQKCEKGKEWGTSDAQGENIFKRVGREGVKYKNQGVSAVPTPLSGRSSSAIDWGNPRKGPGATASFPIGCKNDDEVVQGVIRAVKGDPDGKEIPGGGVDFVWARLRELEALKGWWNNNKLTDDVPAVQEPTPALNSIPGATAVRNAEQTIDGSRAATNSDIGADTKGEITHMPTQLKDKPISEISVENVGNDMETKQAHTTLDAGLLSKSSFPAAVNLDPDTPLSVATADLTRRVTEIYDALPPCTAFIIYSGSGDPREMSRLQAMQQKFKREYKTKKWDELSVKWTDVEEQALRKACKAARNGIAFVTVK